MPTTTIVNPIFQGDNLPITKTDFALMRGAGVWNLPCNAASSTTYVGSGSGTPQPVAWRMSTGATANSSGLYRVNPSGFLNFSKQSQFGFSALGIDFSRPVWLIFSGQIGIYNTGIFRIQLGGHDFNTTTVGQMVATNSGWSGLGFEISSGTIKLETVNTPSGVATRNLSASLGTFATPFSRVDLKAYSDGLGNVKVWINNVFVNTLTIGPTLGTGNNINQLRISIENRASTDSCFVDICQDQLTVIVE